MRVISKPNLLLLLFIVMVTHKSDSLSVYQSGLPRSLLLFRQAGFPKFPVSKTPSNKICGSRKVYHSPPKNLPNEPMPKIVGGSQVPYGAYPWTVHVESLDGGGFSHNCGGTIVSEFHVVTAAHCIHGLDSREVRIKVGDLDTNYPDQSERLYEVESWKVHPQYQKEGLYHNDIAVIKIRSRIGKGIQFDDFVTPACLPSKISSYAPGTWCSVAGWGYTNYDDFYHSSMLQAAAVPLVADNVCRNENVLGPKKIKAGMMCAGYLSGQIDACNGDSGGPLVCQENGHFTLFGVVSWGVNCAQRNKPGVYSNVKFYLDFINQAMKL